MIRTFGSARHALTAAPVPRPPQPINPTLIVPSPATWNPPAALAVAVLAAMIPPAAAAALLDMNCRRFVFEFLVIADSFDRVACEPIMKNVQFHENLVLIEASMIVDIEPEG